MFASQGGRILFVCLIFTLVTSQEVDNEENDGQSSRKILGSSVVTSVSVVMETGNGKHTYYSDAVGHPLTKPHTASQLASPINLLNPDRYEFYTFNDDGELVKRLMTLEEIQGIIAGGDSESLNYNSEYYAHAHHPETAVSGVVENVQNVLKEEMEAHKEPEDQLIFDTPDISATWNMILPAFFGDTVTVMTVEENMSHPDESTEHLKISSRNPENGDENNLLNIPAVAEKPQLEIKTENFEPVSVLYPNKTTNTEKTVENITETTLSSTSTKTNEQELKSTERINIKDEIVESYQTNELPPKITELVPMVTRPITKVNEKTTASVTFSPFTTSTLKPVFVEQQKTEATPTITANYVEQDNKTIDFETQTEQMNETNTTEPVENETKYDITSNVEQMINNVSKEVFDENDKVLVENMNVTELIQNVLLNPLNLNQSVTLASSLFDSSTTSTTTTSTTSKTTTKQDNYTLISTSNNPTKLTTQITQITQKETPSTQTLENPKTTSTTIKLTTTDRPTTNEMKVNVTSTEKEFYTSVENKIITDSSTIQETTEQEVTDFVKIPTISLTEETKMDETTEYTESTEETIWTTEKTTMDYSTVTMIPETDKNETIFTTLIPKETNKIQNYTTTETISTKIPLTTTKQPIYNVTSTILTTLNSLQLTNITSNSTVSISTTEAYRKTEELQKPIKISSSNDNTTKKPILEPEVIKVDLSNQGNFGIPALSEDMYMFSKMYNEIALKFWNSLSIKDINSERSSVVSPFGMISLLAMIFLGARGGTSGEMNDVLKLDDIVTFNPHLVFKEVTEALINRKSSSAVVRELYSDTNKGKILDFYKERVRQFYDGHVEEVDFKKIHNVIRRRTNALISKQTKGKLSNYVEETTLTLRAPLSALSTNIFQEDCSQASTEGRDGELYFIVLPSIRQRRLVPIPAAVWRTGFIAGYDPELDATAVSLGTTNQIISTVFVMPGQQGHSAPGDVLLRLEARLLNATFIPEIWTQLLKSMLPRPGLEIQLPRFLHKSVINTTEALKRMGLKEMFSKNKADLSGLTGISRDLFFSDIIQVNEFSVCGETQQMHSELYPVLSEHFENHNEYTRNFKYVDYFEEEYDKYLSIPLPLRPRQARLPEIPRLRFDRPFLYFVRHNPTGLILHMGRFNPRLLT